MDILKLVGYKSLNGILLKHWMLSIMESTTVLDYPNVVTLLSAWSKFVKKFDKVKGLERHTH